MATTFIGETYLRETIPFNGNVDMNDLTPHIIVAQEMYIQPLLGTNFYNYMISKYSGQTLTTNEEVLMGYIKPVLAFKVGSLSLSFLTYSIKNKGPQTQSGDNSASVDRGVLSYLLNEMDNRFEFYSQRLVNYLDDNSSLFPGYTTNNTTDFTPDKTVYSGPFVFDDVDSRQCFFNRFGYWPNI
jgi:hypothetical protein